MATSVVDTTRMEDSLTRPKSILEPLWDNAEDLIADGKRTEARRVLEGIVSTEVESDDPAGLHVKERAVYRLAEILSMEKQTDALIQLLSVIRPFFSQLPKSKTTRMVRKLFDLTFSSGASLERQMEVCHSMIAWARQEKRTFLRQRLQHRLAEVQFARNERSAALTTLQALLREVRRLDDRGLLLDIHLLESKIYYSIHNTSKSRAALVAALTNANSIYCPPLAQAEIDMQSGVLHAEEHDAKTAFSYLYEAFEGFHQLGDQARQARKALHYMILAKIATDMPDELASLLSSKHVLEYKGNDMDALSGVAEAYNKHDTHLFNRIMESNKNSPFFADDVLQRRLNDMYKSLLERHLLKLLEPYSRVQVAYLASLLRLDEETVESQVSQLILDKKLAGIVDQQHHCVIVFDEHDEKMIKKRAEEAEKMGEAASGLRTIEKPTPLASTMSNTTLYQDALTALENYDRLVTALFDKSSGKFDALVEDNIAKRNAKDKSHNNKEKEKEKNKEKDSKGSNDSKNQSASENEKGDDKNTATGGKK